MVLSEPHKSVWHSLHSHTIKSTRLEISTMMSVLPRLEEFEAWLSRVHNKHSYNSLYMDLQKASLEICEMKINSHIRSGA